MAAGPRSAWSSADLFDSRHWHTASPSVVLTALRTSLVNATVTPGDVFLERKTFSFFQCSHALFIYLSMVTLLEVALAVLVLMGIFAGWTCACLLIPRYFNFLMAHI